ncbi:MAG: hypothetical protein ACM31L_20220 [Actinomycetota bacterium]
MTDFLDPAARGRRRLKALGPGAAALLALAGLAWAWDAGRLPHGTLSLGFLIVVVFGWGAWRAWAVTPTVTCAGCEAVGWPDDVGADGTCPRCGHDTFLAHGHYREGHALATPVPIDSRREIAGRDLASGAFVAVVPTGIEDEGG